MLIANLVSLLLESKSTTVKPFDSNKDYSGINGGNVATFSNSTVDTVSRKALFRSSSIK